MHSIAIVARRRSGKPCALGLSLAFCCLAASSAGWADTKSFHGAVCGPLSTWSTETPVSYHYYGVKNQSTGFAYLSCPVFRDRISSSAGITSVLVEIRNDTQGDDLVECELWTQEEDNGDLDYYDYDSDSSSTTGNVQLELHAGTFSGNESSYYLECRVNTKDIIAHLYVNEADSAD